MLPVLSPEAQDYYEKQDIDGFLHDWQIPLIHKPAFDELVSKGYLVPGTETGVSADGEKTAVRRGYRFAPELIAGQDQGMSL